MEHFSKILGLVDRGEVEFALDLTFGIRSVGLCEELLKVGTWVQCDELLPAFCSCTCPKRFAFHYKLITWCQKNALSGESIPSEENILKVYTTNTKEAKNLNYLKPLGEIENLVELHLLDNPASNLTNFDGLCSLQNVLSLRIEECKWLVCLPNGINTAEPIGKMLNLESIFFHWCEKLTSLRFLLSLPKLVRVCIGGKHNISREDIDAFKKSRPNCSVICERPPRDS